MRLLATKSMGRRRGRYILEDTLLTTEGFYLFVSLSLLFFLPVDVPLLGPVVGVREQWVEGMMQWVEGKVASRLPLENCMDFSLVFEGSLYKNKTKPKL